jgi:hypothetical protein
MRPGIGFWGYLVTQQRFSFCRILYVVALLTILPPLPAAAQSPDPAVKGYEVEWLYRVRYGFIDEWWELWRKYEVPVLERAKSLGYILEYRVYRPTQHMDEAARWDYRVQIHYKDYESSGKLGALYNEIFKDSATRKREDQRRWELTTNHWDLPIYQVDVTRSR